MTSLVLPATFLCASLLIVQTCIIKLLSSGLFLDPLQPGSCFFCYAEAKMLALFLAEAHKSGLSCLEVTVGIGPAVLEIVRLLSSSSSMGEEMVLKRTFSVTVHLLFIDGTHSSAICMQVWLFAPGVFPFLQTKLLAFPLSIYFREIYF